MCPICTFADIRAAGEVLLCAVVLMELICPWLVDCCGGTYAVLGLQLLQF